MEKYIFFVLFLICIAVSAQTSKRTLVQGSIEVPAGYDAEGIAIYNNSTSQGTASGENGSFSIRVALGDSLTFSAVQFRELNLKITQEILESERLYVVIPEAMNELPEISLRSHNLTGILENDVGDVEVVTPAVSAFSPEQIKKYEFAPDAKSVPTNAVTEKGLQNGANILALVGGLVKLLVPDRKAKKEKPQERDHYQKVLLEREIRQLFNDKFFKDHFQIEQTKISEFIFFAEANDLSPELMEEDKRLDLIQFLSEQSEQFRKNASSG